MTIPRRSHTDPSHTSPIHASPIHSSPLAATHSAQRTSRSKARLSWAEPDADGLQQHHELETIQSRVPIAIEDRRESTHGRLEIIAESSGPTVFDRVREHAEGVSEKLVWMRQDQKSNRLRRRRRQGMPFKDRIAAKATTFFQLYIMQGIFRRMPMKPSNDGRHIPLQSQAYAAPHLIDERSGKPYISNFIRSSRYTIYDFVPQQLLFQFSKLGNFYFLVMGILQTIPGLSTVGRWTTIAPLSIFVAFSMAKEGLDDYRRYQLDKSENRSTTLVLTDCVGQDRRGVSGIKAKSRVGWHSSRKGPECEIDEVPLDDLESASRTTHSEPEDWVLMQWQHLRVGDVVRLQRDEPVPADMVLLHATGPNGVAYIETMALDGETNLKAKQACPPLLERCDTIENLRTLNATVISEDPNIHLYSYDGRVTIDSETAPLSLNNVVYRGSILRNTAGAIGVIVNSGEECKIRMNANKNVTAKKPAMQGPVNKMIMIQIVIVLMIATGFLIGYLGWQSREKRSFYIVEKHKYNAEVPHRNIWFGYLLMFNTLIPLSLYISLEIVKLGQLWLLHDEDMYDPVSNTPMVANTTTILENLGQVSYVFSDKTGTLTENLMRFRKMSVAGVACLHDMDVLRDEKAKQTRIDTMQMARSNRKSTASWHISQMNRLSSDVYANRNAHYEAGTAPGRASTGSATYWKSSARPDEAPEMKTEDLLLYIQRKPNTTFARKAKHFLLCIALCHTCLPETKDDGSVELQAASPDELALVEAAQDLGYMLIDRPAQCIKLQSRDSNGNMQTETYQVLDVIEFSSKRKRMSIILRMPDRSICVICKGADNVITSRLKLSHIAEQKAREVEQMSSMRKTFEQHKLNKRLSMQASAKSTPRSSFNIKRGETFDHNDRRWSAGRLSVDLKKPAHTEATPGKLKRNRTEDFGTPRTSVDFLRNRPLSTVNPVASFDAIEQQVDEAVAANESAILERCFQHIDEFATDGLRTLLYAYRYIDEETYTSWKATYKEAETSLVDRQERIEAAADLIEQRFDLAGATAIEDKLQEGVPETIDMLCRANVRVWMLTGDKRETAINIGHSARVCKPYSEMYILDAAAPGSLLDTLKVTLNDVSRGMAPHSVLVVDGQTLAAIDADDDLAVLFYDLVVRVDSVICCRASPSQKANLVKAIRRYVPKSMTLAIGDGANDIGMIQASHVGIGISGREGLQAARISDYSIAQFRFLQKLLFVHGRWNYLRTGKYVLATFWKEIFFYLMQAHFQRYTGYTGTSLYESWSLTTFNTLFTSLAVILLGIFERDLSAKTLLKFPELYTFGQKNLGFNFKQYVGWVVLGVLESCIVFYFTRAVYDRGLSTDDTSLYAIGSICFTVGVVFINLKLLVLDLHTKTIITFGGFIISVGAWFIWMLILAVVYNRGNSIYIVRGAFLHNFGRQLVWWATALIALMTITVIELAVQALRRVYWPTDQDLMQRIEQDQEALKAMEDHERDTEAAMQQVEEEHVAAAATAAAGGAAVRDASRASGHRLSRLSHDGSKPEHGETLREKLEKLKSEL